MRRIRSVRAGGPNGVPGRWRARPAPTSPHTADRFLYEGLQRRGAASRAAMDRNLHVEHDQAREQGWSGGGPSGEEQRRVHTRTRAPRRSAHHRRRTSARTASTSRIAVAMKRRARPMASRWPDIIAVPLTCRASRRPRLQEKARRILPEPRPSGRAEPPPARVDHAARQGKSSGPFRYRCVACVIAPPARITYAATRCHLHQAPRHRAGLARGA